MKESIREYLTQSGEYFASRRFRDLVQMDIDDIRRGNASRGGDYWGRGNARIFGTSEVGNPEIGPGGVFIVQRVTGDPGHTATYWRVIEYNPATGRIDNGIDSRGGVMHPTARGARKAARDTAGKWIAAELVEMGIDYKGYI